jgi:ammonium transporter Rh
LIKGDFAAGAVLISFGAVLGKINPFQLLIMAIFEICFMTLNETIGVENFKASDMGGSMFVHLFGAWFGIGLTYTFSPKEAKNHPKASANYNSNLIAMVGTLFLWMFWPSFNGALAEGNSQHRVVLNTVIALTASCLGAFIVSGLLRSNRHKLLFDMEDVLNATLAGGVMIGTSSDMVLQPAVSIFIGFFAGCLSAFGFCRISPYLSEKFGIYDTCGVNNLHGIPGFLGGLIGVIIAGS